MITKDVLTRVILVAWAIIFVGAFIISWGTKPSRERFYFTPSEIALHLKPDTVEKSLEARLKIYQDARSALTKDIFLAATILAISIVVLYKRSPTFKVPILDEPVPRRLIYYAIPIIACYAWLQFGYDLNSCLDLRISSFQLLSAQLKMEPFLNIANLNPTTLMKAHYTFTRAFELDDRGFIDSWLFIFGPEGNPVFDRGGIYNKIVPGAALFLYAALYGGLHACQIVFSYLLWQKRRDCLWGCLLTLLMAFFLLMSHFTFYFAGGYWNVWQPTVLFFGLVFFIFFTNKSLGQHTAERLGTDSN